MTHPNFFQMPRRLTRPLFATLFAMLMVLDLARPVHAVQIAGELLMDFDASGFNQSLGIWTNNDTTGLTYGNFTGTGPTAATVLGVPAVSFINNRMNTGVNSNGFGITGNDTWSVELWAYNPAIASEEAILGWAPRNIGTSQTAHVGYGSNGTFGAAVHWGNDLGFAGAPAANTWHHIAYTFDGATERVYVDGSLNNSKATTLNIASGYTATLGAAGNSVANSGNNLPFSGSVSQIRFHTDTLSAADVLTNYNLEKFNYPVAYTSAATGNWSTPGTWNIAPPVGGPGTFDTATVQSGHDVAYDIGAPGSVGAVTINGAAGISSLTLGQNLNVAGTVLMQGGNSALLDLNGHKLTADKLEITATPSQNAFLPVLQRTGGGTLDVNTLYIHNGGSTTFTLDPGDVIGNLRTEASGGTGNSGIDVVTSATGNITDSVYIGWHGINELKLGAPLVISGNMTLERGTLVSQGQNVTVGGNWYHGALNQGGTFNRTGGGTLTLNGALTPDWNDGGGGTFPTLPGDVFNGTVGFGWVQTNANSFLDMNQSTGQMTGVTVNGTITDQIWDRGQYAIRLFFDGSTTGNGTDWGLRWLGNQVSTLTTWDNRSDAPNVGDLTLQYSGNPRGADVSIWYDSNDNYTYVGYTANFRKWDNPGSGPWETSGNWDPTIVPDSISVSTVDNGGTANVTAPGAQSQTILLDLGTVNVNAGGSLNVANRIEVAATGNLVSTGSLTTPLIETAGSTTLSGSGSIGTVNVNGGTTSLSGSATLGTVNANSGTVNMAGATVGSLNALGSTVNVTANSTATNLLVNTPTGSVNITGGDLATSNGQLQSGLVSTSGSHALVVSDGGTLKVGSNVPISAAGATARVLGSDIINPTAGQHNTLSLVGGTVTLTGVIGPAGAAADMTNVKHQWTFNDGTAADARGVASVGQLSGTASISGGALHMSGSSGNNRMIATLNSALAYNKTLMAWFTLDSLSPNSPDGGPLGVQNSAANLFDSIDYGERKAGQWMAGSDFFRRSNGVDNGGAIETVAGAEIMMAISYDSVAGKITLYRNGAQYAQYNQTTNLQTYDAAAQSIFGPRVGTAGFFNGAVNEARIYDTPLSGSQILDIYNSFYSPLGINMPFWDVEVNHTTTLALDTTADVVLGDLIINLGAHSPPDTILEILSDASSISWDNLIINGPAASGQYTLVDWSDWTGASDAFFDGMFDSVVFNGVAGSLTYLNDQIIFNAQAEAVPEPGTLALAAVGLLGLGCVVWRRRK